MHTEYAYTFSYFEHSSSWPKWTADMIIIHNLVQPWPLHRSSATIALCRLQLLCIMAVYLQSTVTPVQYSSPLIADALPASLLILSPFSFYSPSFLLPFYLLSTSFPSPFLFPTPTSSVVIILPTRLLNNL